MSEFDWNSLKDIVPSYEARPPAQSFTLRDFMEKRGVTKGSAENALTAALAAGKLERAKFWSASQRQWCFHYWLPEKKK